MKILREGLYRAPYYLYHTPVLSATTHEYTEIIRSMRRMMKSHIIIDIFLNSSHPILYMTLEYNILPFISYITLILSPHDPFGSGGLMLNISYPFI